MADFRASIPGWLDAVKAEAAAHELAFAAPHDVVCGVPVRHLSLVDMCRMAQIGNPFFGDCWPSLAEVSELPEICTQAAEVVAYQDIGYKVPRGCLAPLHRHRFRKTRNKVARMDPVELWSELIGYFERTFADQVASDKRNQGDPVRWSLAVEYVDLLGHEYGWTADYVLNMPYRQLIQCVRKIIKRKDPDAPLPSKADMVIAEYLKEKREKRNAEAAKEGAK